MVVVVIVLVLVVATDSHNPATSAKPLGAPPQPVLIHILADCDELSKEQDSRLPQGQPLQQPTASPSVQQQDSTLPEDQQQTQPTVLLLADLVDIKLSNDQLLKRLTAPSTQRGEEQYTQWLSTVEKTLQQVHHTKTFYTLTAHIDMLKVRMNFYF